MKKADTARITLLLADDHSLVREGLNALLQAEPELNDDGGYIDDLITMRDAMSKVFLDGDLSGANDMATAAGEMQNSMLALAELCQN